MRRRHRVDRTGIVHLVDSSFRHERAVPLQCWKHMLGIEAPIEQGDASMVDASIPVTCLWCLR